MESRYLFRILFQGWFVVEKVQIRLLGGIALGSQDEAILCFPKHLVAGKHSSRCCTSVCRATETARVNPNEEMNKKHLLRNFSCNRTPGECRSCQIGWGLIPLNRVWRQIWWPGTLRPSKQFQVATPLEEGKSLERLWAMPVPDSCVIANGGMEHWLHELP
jgi:hypothetical protein